jgi:hypothetical protein
MQRVGARGPEIGRDRGGKVRDSFEDDMVSFGVGVGVGACVSIRSIVSSARAVLWALVDDCDVPGRWLWVRGGGR